MGGGNIGLRAVLFEQYALCDVIDAPMTGGQSRDVGTALPL